MTNPPIVIATAALAGLLAHWLTGPTMHIRDCPAAIPRQAAPPRPLLSGALAPPPLANPPPPVESARLQVSEDIESRDAWGVLGAVKVLQSDLLDMENGEQHRHSVVAASKVDGPVLVIERFGATGSSSYPTYHSAGKVEVSLADAATLAKVAPKLEAAAVKFAARPGRGRRMTVEVESHPSPSRIFETLEMLEALVGGMGDVYLPGPQCLQLNPSMASPADEW